MGFFDTRAPTYKGVSSGVIDRAAGVGKGDIFKDGTELLHKNLKRRDQNEYTRSVQDTLTNGSLEDLMKVDVGRLSPDGAKGLTAKQGLMKTKFLQNADGRAARKDARVSKIEKADDIFTKLMAQGKENGFMNLSQDELAPLYDQMGFTEDEMEAVEETKGNNNTLPAGVLPAKMRESINRKTRMQTEIGNLQSSGQLTSEETDYEQVQRVISGMEHRGEFVTDKMYEDLRSREAAAVTAKQSKRASLLKSIELLQKDSTGWLKEQAKADDKSGGRTGSKGGAYLDSFEGFTEEKYMNYNDAFKALQDHVSAGGSTFEWGDAKNIKDARALLHTQGYTDDETLYALSQQVDNGLLGNNVEDGKTLAKKAVKYREDYKKLRRTSGGKSGKNMSAMAQKEVLGNNSQLSLLQKQLAALDITPQQKRDKIAADAVRAIIPGPGGGINNDTYVPGGTQKPKEGKGNAGTIITGKGKSNFKRPEDSTDLLAAAMKQSDVQAAENETISGSSTKPGTSSVKPSVGGAPSIGEFKLAERKAEAAVTKTPLEKAVAQRELQQQQREIDDRPDSQILNERLTGYVSPGNGGGQDPFNIKGFNEQMAWVRDKLGLSDTNLSISVDPRNLQSGLFTQQPRSRTRNKVLQAPQLTPVRMREIAKQSPAQLERTYSMLSEEDKLLLVQYIQAQGRK